MVRKRSIYLPIHIAVTVFVAAVLVVVAIGSLGRAQAGARLASVASSQEARPHAPIAFPPGLAPSVLAHLTRDEPASTLAVATPVATIQPDPTAVPLPNATAAPPNAMVENTPRALGQSEPQTLALTGLRHEWQTWNNCGPATLAMYLSYFGSPLDQAAIRTVLRPDPDDKNVSPHELAGYAIGQGFVAGVRVDGNAELLRQFLDNGIPVLIETWLEPEPNDGLGHYRLITGYDDTRQSWIAYDAYVSTNLVDPSGASYQGIYLPYGETSHLWSVFNHAYVLVYPPFQAPTVRDILGPAFEPDIMWAQALAGARRQVEVDPDNAFAWFNLGSDLVRQAEYGEAALAYDRARALGLPWRMLWYQFGPFEAYYETERYHDVNALADATLAVTGSIEEIHYWKGMAIAALGDLPSAQAAWNKALNLNPTFHPALDALQSLTAQSPQQ